MNVAPPYFGEKVVDLQGFAPAFIRSTFCIIAWKRGSFLTLS